MKDVELRIEHAMGKKPVFQLYTRIKTDPRY